MRLARHLWLASLLAVILAGALVLALRLLLPLAGDYRGEVAAWLSERLGRPVTIERMGMEWQGAGPALLLDGVAVGGAGGEPAGQLQRLYLSLDLATPFRDPSAQWWALRLAGVRLALRRDGTGRITFAGLGGGTTATAEEAPAEGGLAAALFGLPRLGLVESELELSDEGSGRVVRLGGVRLDLRNGGRGHRLRGAVTLPPELGGEVVLVAELAGPPADPARWSGRLFLRAAGLRAAGVAALLGALAGDTALNGDLALWGEWTEGRVSRATGEVTLRDGAAALAAARLFWGREGEGWRLLAEPVEQGVPLLFALHAAGLNAGFDAGAGVTAEVEALDLGLAARLATLLPLPAEPRAALAALSPGGVLRDARLQWRPATAEAPSGLRLQGRIDGWRNRAWRGLPAIAGLDLTVDGDDRAGAVAVAGQAVAIHLPALFRGPFPAATLAGRLDWRRDDDGVALWSRELRADNADLATTTRFSLLLPAGGGSPLLDLCSSYRDGDGRHAGRYYPAAIMPHEAVAWLDRAIVAARVPGGGVLFRGRLGDFPFDDRSGRFEVRFEVEDGLLDYQEGWPRLEELAAEVAFVDRGMRAEAVAGKILGGQVRRLTATIPDLLASRLAIAGDAAAPVADLLRVVRETPLAGSVGRYFEGVSGAGDGGLRLKVDLDLTGTGDGEPRVSGAVRFDDGRLANPAWRLDLAQLKGEVAFDGAKGLAAERLEGQLWGRPVRVAIDAVKEGGRRLARFLVSGRFDVAQFPGGYAPALVGPLAGEGEWRVAVRMPPLGGAGERRSVGVRVESDLKGVTVALPAPLGKEAAEARPSWTELQLGEAGPEGAVSFQYGTLASGQFRLGDGERVTAAALHFGAAPPSRLPPRGLRLDGRLPPLALEEWLALAADDGKGGSAKKGGAGWPELTGAELTLAGVRYGGRDLGALELALQPDEERWHLELKGERVAGTVTIPRDGGEPVEAELERLLLPSPPEGEGPAEPAAETRRSDPRRLPPLRLHSRAFALDEMTLGSLDLATDPSPDGLRIGRLKFASDVLKGEVTGSWRVVAGDPQRQRTELHGGLATGDLGQGLAALGYAGTLSDGDGEMKGELGWDDGPGGYAAAKLEGKLSLALHKGRILEVSPGAGRVFGLLSIHALPRRLSLDFSDLFKKGFSFDAVTGSFAIHNGQAETDDLTVTGPAARIEIDGRVGLASHDYDQRMAVYPQLSSTLPIAGTLAGGPAVGAALLVAERLLRDQLDRITRVDYHVTGPWHDPQVERVRVEERKGGAPAGE